MSEDTNAAIREVGQLAMRASYRHGSNHRVPGCLIFLLGLSLGASWMVLILVLCGVLVKNGS